MNWFANVGKYLWSREATPYLTAPEAMTPTQARYEVFAYAVLLGSVFAIVGAGGAIAAFRDPAPTPLIWALGGALVLWACIILTTRRATAAAWIVAAAPSALLVHFALSGFSPQATRADKVLLVVFVLALLRYGWRIIRIVRHQRVLGSFGPPGRNGPASGIHDDTAG